MDAIQFRKKKIYTNTKQSKCDKMLKVVESMKKYMGVLCIILATFF